MPTLVDEGKSDSRQDGRIFQSSKCTRPSLFRIFFRHPVIFSISSSQHMCICSLILWYWYWLIFFYVRTMIWRCWPTCSQKRTEYGKRTQGFDEGHLFVGIFVYSEPIFSFAPFFVSISTCIRLCYHYHSISVLFIKYIPNFQRVYTHKKPHWSLHQNHINIMCAFWNYNSVFGLHYKV